ncbi:hypothetical protein CEXT_171611 [Caerostris extrusa]|uniref:Uncharacterized protein n=1 Tax=Caerostris extrusa TaxID=172846 RepID=A0AAV4QZ48_CAEEX|nr:hypothetical protein CEXT_171611 [Caerostris extrusa]
MRLDNIHNCSGRDGKIDLRSLTGGKGEQKIRTPPNECQMSGASTDIHLIQNQSMFGMLCFFISPSVASILLFLKRKIPRVRFFTDFQLFSSCKSSPLGRIFFGGGVLSVF